MTYKKFNNTKKKPTKISETILMIWTLMLLIYLWQWKWKSLSRVRLIATPWTIQAMEFSRPEYWSGQPFPSLGDLPNPRIKPMFPALQVDSLPAEPQGKPNIFVLKA